MTQKSISAGIIIYRKTHRGPKFLVLYHGNGYWNFPKGHIELGERRIEAAFREVSEETGIRPKDLSLKKEFRMTNKYLLTREGKKIFRIVILFLAESKHAEVKLSSEHDGYGWFLYRDAVRLLRYGSLRDILKKADSLL